jgi:hypothetical protein
MFEGLTKKLGQKNKNKNISPSAFVDALGEETLPRVLHVKHSGKRGPDTRGRGPFPKCHVAALGKASRPSFPFATGPVSQRAAQSEEVGTLNLTNPPNPPSPPHTPPPAPLPPSARARWPTPLPAPAPAHPTPPDPTEQRPPTPATPAPTSDPRGGGARRSGESRVGRSGERERDDGGLVLLPATASCSSRRRPRPPSRRGLERIEAIWPRGG